MSRNDIEQYSGAPITYTGPVTTAQAEWMRQVAEQTQPNAPAPVIIQLPPTQPVNPVRYLPGSGPNWTAIALIAAFLVLAVVGMVAVSCANTPPPPTVHKVFPNCRVGCW